MVWFYLGGKEKGISAEDSQELLRQLRIVTQRDGLVADRDLTDAKGYLFLTHAQRALFYRIATHLPELMKGAPEKMTTTDGGLTYQTRSDPIGHIEIYDNKYSEQPLVGGPLWDASADYTVEGVKKIRMQGNRLRVFADGPYARYVKKPGVIDDVSAPSLEPTDARSVLPWMAAALWAQSGNLHDASGYLRMVTTMLTGDPDDPSDPGIIGAYKQQHAMSGMSGAGPNLWWRSQDLGSRG